MNKRLYVVATTALLAFGVGQNAHATLDLSQAPLFLVTPVKPALVVALDDSGSMDGEIILPTNDGAAWWHTSDQAYIGRGFDAAAGNNTISEGVFNFNWNGGANRTWKKTTYLFPNGVGSGQGRRNYADNNNDHFALPPLPEYSWARSPSYNAQYFRPDSNYPPYPDTDDQTFSDINPTAAPWDPIYGAANFTVDLTSTIRSDDNGWLFRLYDGKVIPAGTSIDPDYGGDRGRACDSFGTGGSNDWRVTTTDIEIAANNNDDYCPAGIEYFPATFWIRADDVAEMVPADFGFINANRLQSVSGPVEGSNARALMFGYEIKPGNFTSTEAYRKAMQSFANWFSYYRKRSMTLRGALGRAFAPFTFLRVGNFTINNRNTVNMIDLEDPQAKSDFLEWAYDLRGTGGTPNRQAVLHMGQQFERTGGNAPVLQACQRNFGMLFTDGYATTWTNAGVGNADGGQPPPIGDTNANTMADIAYSFYKDSIRPDLEAGRVPVPSVCSEATPPLNVNCQSDPHMNFYGVSMGGDGIVYNVDEDATLDPWTNPPTWLDPNAERNPSAIDDLWHATLSTHGEMFSARSPDEVAGAIQGVLASIASLTTTVGVSANSTRLNAGSVVFQSIVDSTDWSGDVRSLDAVSGATLGSAADALAAAGFNARNIVTWDPVADNGVDFEPTGEILARVFNSIPAAELPAVLPAVLFDYLKGDLNAGFGVFRERGSMLGDIVGSQPVFSGPGNEGWADLDLAYLDYIDEDKRDPRDPCDAAPCPGNRRNTVFVGANDGMLHAFDAATLEEHFAYVPAAVHKDLYQLADPDYVHRYFVDGQMAVGDAKLGGSWGTYLVGSLGAGGRGIYALDVTQPQNFDAGDVLWEFTAEDDEDLGLTFGKPAIGRTAGGQWIAVFGNGYNSEDNQAYLYVLNLETGVVIDKVAVGVPGKNGLSGVALVPSPNDPLHVKYIYAGDLEGNMWRFDVATNGTATPSFGADPLFSDPTIPEGRPIISEPNVALHPTSGFMVYFGTGKLIETVDRTNSSTLDRFYALRDQDAPITSIASLDEVTVTAGPSGGRVFTPTGSGINGWYADLAVGSPRGERVLFSPLVFAGRVVFSSYEPSNDPCTPGGLQRAYVLRALSGSGALPDDTAPNVGGIELPDDGAFAPVIGIKDAPDATGTPGYDAGYQTPDPDCPVGDPNCTPDPVDPTSVPGAAGGGRDNWCRTIGLQQPGSWIPIGQLCEGRQAWRQIR